MKADDCKSSTRLQTIGNCLQSRFQRLQLLINRNPQRLERPRRRINSVCRARHTLAQEMCQIARRLDWLILPLLNNPPGDPAAKSLFSELIDEVGQLPFRQASKQLPRRLAFV